MSLNKQPKQYFCFPFEIGKPCPRLVPEIEGIYFEASYHEPFDAIFHWICEAHRRIPQDAIDTFNGHWEFGIHVSPEMPMGLPLARLSTDKVCRFLPLAFDITYAEARNGYGFYDPFLEHPFTAFFATISEFHRDPNRRIVRGSRIVEPPPSFCIELANMLKKQRGIVRDDCAEQNYLLKNSYKDLWDTAIKFYW